jgi:GMP synthase (glutamine-hydrolysing)
MKLKVVEPLNTLFKDEVRLVGKTLGIDPNILGRHPFPGLKVWLFVFLEILPQKK